MSAERSLLRRMRGLALAGTVTVSLVGGTCVLGLTEALPASAQTFGEAVVARAATFYGVPYVYGGTTPAGFDCSGYTGYVFRMFGVNLPRTAAEQYGAVAHVPQGQQQPGDLIFFYDGSGIYHVGIYAGGGNIWAATHTGDIVREEQIWTNAYVVGRVSGGSAAPTVGGAIGGHWQALGGAAGFLGQPLNTEHDVPGGREVDFQGGSILWSYATGAWSVRGAIQGAYAGRGGAGSGLGLPVTDESGTPDGVGRYNHFSNGASIYWTPATGAHEVQGLIRQEWAATGWERGPMGYPVTDESATPDGVGRYNHFSNGASIYWTPTTGAHEVQGLIRQEWAATGWERGPMGYPITDESGTPDGVGRYNHFSNGASIYWSPATGAHEVQGLIRQQWAATGWETGIGYPVTDETATRDGRGRYNDFSRGASIYWSPATGAHVISGALRDAWRAAGDTAGSLGFPVDDVHAVPGGLVADFQGGSISWSSATGATVIRPH